MILVATPLPGSDHRWWLLWSGAVIVIAALIAALVSMFGPRPAEITEASVLPVIAALVLGIGSLLVLWIATSSSAPAPSLFVDFYLLAPVMVAAGTTFVTAIICRLLNTLRPVSTFVATLSSVAMAMAVIVYIGELPIRFRVERNEQALTAQAVILEGHPEWFGSRDSTGHWSGTLDLTVHPIQLGDFDVVRVELDDYDLPNCVDGAAAGGLRFVTDAASTRTALIYCPLKEPEPSDIHSTIDHLSGPWYLNASFD